MSPTDVLSMHTCVISEQELLSSLPLVSQCPEEEVELLKFLYENRLKKVYIQWSISLWKQVKKGGQFLYENRLKKVYIQWSISL